MVSSLKIANVLYTLVTQKPSNYVVNHCRDIVVAVIVGETPTKSYRANRENAATVRGIKIYNICPN